MVIVPKGAPWMSTERKNLRFLLLSSIFCFFPLSFAALCMQRCCMLKIIFNEKREQHFDNPQRSLRSERKLIPFVFHFKGFEIYSKTAASALKNLDEKISNPKSEISFFRFLSLLFLGSFFRDDDGEDEKETTCSTSKCVCVCMRLCIMDIFPPSSSLALLFKKEFFRRLRSCETLFSPL